MMWSRADLKARAKEALRSNYWRAFLVSLVLILTGGSHNWRGGEAGSSGGPSAGSFDPAIIPLIVLGLFLFLAFRIFIGYAVEVGGRKFFIRLSGHEADLHHLGYGFQARRYRPIVGSMLRRGVYLLLWFLLLIIPGIIKFYAYRMVPYILSENPSIGSKRSLELSSSMTRGQKFDIFVLDLSFIGWFILGALALGVGVLFVQPYYDATNAELYLSLRERALDEGLTSPEELGGAA
jgi:hypothetical protein